MTTIKDPATTRDRATGAMGTLIEGDRRSVAARLADVADEHRRQLHHNDDNAHVLVTVPESYGDEALKLIMAVLLGRARVEAVFEELGEDVIEDFLSHEPHRHHHGENRLVQAFQELKAAGHYSPARPEPDKLREM
jgi:hypothetical protein